MNHSVLLENENRRLALPRRRMLCFAAFCAWQMGFIYFMSPALVIDGRTPLPIDMDNVTALIAASYVASILFMSALPWLVIAAARFSAAVSLLSVLGLYLPLSPENLTLLLYVQVFFCCFMIGFETFTIVNYFSDHSAIWHLTIAYSAALLVIALVQNDLVPITFPLFRAMTVGLVTLLLVFYCRMPARREACPRFKTRADGLTLPRALTTGVLLLVFVGAIMAVSGPSIAGQQPHGVSVTYLLDALASIVVYALYKRAGIHPFRSLTICLSAGCAGFLLMLTVPYVPALAWVACGLIGIGMVPCQMIPLFGAVLVRSFPSRHISSVILTLALAAVLVQSSMVEIFRGIPRLLLLVYGVIMAVLVMIYLQVAPYILNTLQKKSPAAPGHTAPASTPTPEDPRLAELTDREREVLDLIACGYTNGDIARILVISPHTVNDYTKKIYRKLEVHSRHAATSVLNRHSPAP